MSEPSSPAAPGTLMLDAANEPVEEPRSVEWGFTEVAPSTVVKPEEAATVGYAPSSILCRVGWHAWCAWGPRFRASNGTLVQVRACGRCALEQARAVRVENMQIEKILDA